jgi:hypothetical protein
MRTDSFLYAGPVGAANVNLGPISSRDDLRKVAHRDPGSFSREHGGHCLLILVQHWSDFESITNHKGVLNVLIHFFFVGPMEE